MIFLQSSKLGLDARIRYMEDVPGEEGVRRFVPNSSIWGLELFVLFTFNIALHGLYNIHTVLHNPFGPRHIDVAHEVIAGGIRKLMVGLMDANERLPPSMLPEHMRAQQMPAAHQPSPMNGARLNGPHRLRRTMVRGITTAAHELRVRSCAPPWHHLNVWWPAAAATVRAAAAAAAAAGGSPVFK